MSEPVPGPPIFTRSIVSHRTRRGIVVVEWGPMAGQFDPEDVRVRARIIEDERTRFINMAADVEGPADATGDSEYAAFARGFEEARRQIIAKIREGWL